MVFPENIGAFLSIDEVSLSQGELYTFVTNKAGKGKKGTIVASIKGTRSADIFKVLEKIPLKERSLVKEITLDMAKNMESGAKQSFPKAQLVTDRFHVVKLIIDAVQHTRIKLRWDAIDAENTAISEAKEKKIEYLSKVFENGDTPKQLLSRARFLLSKKEVNWTLTQKERAEILFKEYPIIKEAYHFAFKARNCYENTTYITAKERLIEWIEEAKAMSNNKFNSVANSLEYNLDNILNFFNNRNTNANAESFNSKIKLFRANQRGVADVDFFLFRLSKLFA